ncbi:flagellar basal-body rod modification protein FlgD [Acetitomaculum ruminis DSM 5522]|uniref:Basal-body rod modification protein FlgD n=1 Tax=Acetitomaculum ruminis DSM 5522 TaxID=1120918 RepID=A0A1I0ZH52_9FIRM|nr:flagellar hook capping FlgD N-terminal domain-containing protein [Acetitomaculum ruminis]SFB25089.1 flagellar basal-body rod modification protein FlgD [Acetitomaculum ruminis DSM 5522]
MPNIVPVVDGVIQSDKGKESSNTTKKSNSSMDKNAFLQLLVAEMQYQDPLEPTANTEYISQFATFSQLEELQNVSAVTKQTLGSDLIGKIVVVQSTDKQGATNYVEGMVDYILQQNNNTYLSVNGGLYKVDDLYQVVDQDYYEAMDVLEALYEKLSALPATDKLTLSDQAAVTTARRLYNSLNEKGKGYVSSELLNILTDAEEKIAELKKAVIG